MLQKEVDACYRQVLRSTYLALLVVVAPMVMACLVKIFWTKTLFVSSAFAPNPMERVVSNPIVIYQSLTVYFLVFG